MAKVIEVPDFQSLEDLIHIASDPKAFGERLKQMKATLEEIRKVNRQLVATEEIESVKSQALSARQVAEAERQKAIKMLADAKSDGERIMAEAQGAFKAREKAIKEREDQVSDREKKIDQREKVVAKNLDLLADQTAQLNQRRDEVMKAQAEVVALKKELEGKLEKVNVLLGA